VPVRKQPRIESPTTPPSFTPSTSEPLRVHLDAYVHVRRHGLAIDPHKLARDWLTDQGEAFWPGDVMATE
jgi:hypothetical protein